MLKKSIGFNWGACATSTGYWTGVRLRDLLLLAGTKVRGGGSARGACKQGLGLGLGRQGVGASAGACCCPARCMPPCRRSAAC